MFDYKLLHAFANVVEWGSFERAAKHMGLTQSAVSQRVKLLESRLGEPLLIRGGDMRTTETGQAILNHVARVMLLEQELSSTVALPESEPARIRIAINHDSVSSWWFSALKPFFEQANVKIDLVLEDQNYGLSRMKKGDVSAVLCTDQQPLQGARCAYVGELECGIFASSNFVEQYFSEGVTPQAIKQAPVVLYDYRDGLQAEAHRQLKLPTDFPYHMCPSTMGIEHMINEGIAYGILALKQVEDSVKNGRCQLLTSPQQAPCLSIPLYWHYWRQGSEIFEQMLAFMRKQLPQTHKL